MDLFLKILAFGGTALLAYMGAHVTIRAFFGWVKSGDSQECLDEGV